MAERKKLKSKTSKKQDTSGKPGKMYAVPYEHFLYKRLADPQYAMDYLSGILAEEAPECFLIALNDVIEAHKINKKRLSARTGITRQGLHRALSKNGNPRLSTITQLLDSLGFQLSVSRKRAA